MVNEHNLQQEQDKHMYHGAMNFDVEELHVRNVCLGAIRTSERAYRILTRRTCHESDQVSKVVDIAFQKVLVYLRYPLSRIYTL